jgi:L-threonylcarbamoyladenylate synthase
MNDEKLPIIKNKVTPYWSQHRTVTTQLFSSHDPAAVSAVTEAVQHGELVVIPTDTVYGVGANAFDEVAIQALFFAKRRSAEKGIPILLADQSDLYKVAASVSPVAEDLIARFWPGPLTLVLPKREDLPSSLSDTESVAVRIPEHDISRALIRASGGMLATTSANLSGLAPALTAQNALNDLAGMVSVVIDDGPSLGQMASTVVDCTQDPIRILRSGLLTMDDLLEGKSLSL